ncbi:transcriptional regulator ArsR family [Clostridium aceticum]|uniref:Transcriptional regulator ArsR family n=1 Tax=Clostridium aceticum TaxID=84022 RepID=A0A0G3WD31_9CLOT|nr:metalloregulator ArsR/SmtB family transcription factor [Clostridium aceticum]AKL96536.1 transcriptional regulator ArsR family [Clostridium aceticum]
MKKDCSFEQKCLDGHICTSDHKCSSEEALQKVKREMPEDVFFLRLEELFKVMGSQTRLRIIFALMEANELCVEHLADTVNISVSAISHQLKGLRQLRLVKTRKQAQSVYYSLDDEHIALLFNTARTHLSEEDDF